MLDRNFLRASLSYQQLCVTSTAQQNKVLLNKKLTRVIKYQYEGIRGWQWHLELDARYLNFDFSVTD